MGAESKRVEGLCGSFRETARGAVQASQVSVGLRVAWIGLGQELVIFDGLLELTGDVFVETHDTDQPVPLACACSQSESLGQIFACLPRFRRLEIRRRRA